MRRLLLKRDLFDGNKLWEAGEPADVSDDFQPPRDAEVWDGDKYVRIPTNKDGTVNMDELASVAGDPPPPEDEVPYENFYADKSVPAAKPKRK